jgi:hypothetical protein
MIGASAIRGGSRQSCGLFEHQYTQTGALQKRI